MLEAATDVVGRGGGEVTPADRLFSHLLQVNLRQTPHGVPEPSHTARFRPSEWLALEWAPFWTASVIGGADGAVVEAERLPISAMLAKGAEQPDPLLREVLAWVDRDFRSIQGLATNLTSDLAAAEQALTDIPKVLSARVTPEEAKRFKDALVSLAFETMVADGEVKMETEAAAMHRVRQALQA